MHDLKVTGTNVIMDTTIALGSVEELWKNQHAL